MFNHLTLPPLPILDQITEQNGSRKYRIANGLCLPSVTTILKYADPNKNDTLARWRNNIGDKAADAILENSRTRGTTLDKMVEDHLNNIDKQPIEYINNKPDGEAAIMFGDLHPFLQNINNIHFLQPMLYSEKLGTAGSADIITEYNGVLTVIDIKNSRKPRTPAMIVTYYLQVTAYALMYSEMTGNKVANGLVLMAVEDDATQLFHFKIVDYIRPLLKAINTYQKQSGIVS